MAALPGILTQTTNLIRLFLYTRGVDEIPPQFYVWSFLVAMAACVRDKLTVPQLVGRPLYPNLYVILYGPPGCGKGAAIDAVTPLVKGFPVVNLYEGAINGPTLYRELHKIKNRKCTRTGELIQSKMFLVMEELGMHAGMGKEAEQFIRYLTEIWRPHPGIKMKATTAHGRYELRDTCVNFLGGTTRHWLFDVVQHRDFQAGTGRRLVMVEGNIDPAKRATVVKAPEGAEHVLDYIKYRLEALTYLSGEIPKLPETLAWEEAWYKAREDYVSEEDIPLWRQEPELMNRIAMGLVLADGDPELRMYPHHLQRGLVLARQVQASIPRIIAMAKTPDSGLLHEVASIVRDYPGITWKDLMKRSELMANRLRLIVSSLEQRGTLTSFIGSDKLRRYIVGNGAKSDHTNADPKFYLEKDDDD